MTHVTVITADQRIGLDGQFLQVEMAYPPGLWALQWDGQQGTFEWAPNEAHPGGRTQPATLDDVQPYIAAYHQAKQTLYENNKTTELAQDPNVTARAQRDAQLKETDKWALSDRPLTLEQQAYRQALRDLPNTYDWQPQWQWMDDDPEPNQHHAILAGIAWPSKPTVITVPIATTLFVTPNLLADTQHWQHLCGGQQHQIMDIFAAHGGPWCCFWDEGTQGTGTCQVVTVDQLADHACPYGEVLEEACQSTFVALAFFVVILDITMSTPGLWYVLNQGEEQLPHRGYLQHDAMATEAAVFACVIEHTGDILFNIHAALAGEITLDGDQVGLGWQYHTSTQAGLGQCHQPHFICTGSAGHMKVAIALPYVGMGHHAGLFVFADANQPGET